MEKKKLKLLKYCYLPLWLTILAFLTLIEIVLRIREYNLSLSEVTYTIFFVGWLGAIFLYRVSSRITFTLALMLFVLGAGVSLVTQLGDISLRVSFVLLLIGFGQTVVEVRKK